MARACTHAEGRCRASAHTIEAATLPVDAFGSTTHSHLISAMADRFRTGMHARLRSLVTVARDFQESDRCAAEGLRRVARFTAPSEWQPGPQERLVGPARLVP
jgi:hypothetical protein